MDQKKSKQLKQSFLSTLLLVPTEKSIYFFYGKPFTFSVSLQVIVVKNNVMCFWCSLTLSHYATWKEFCSTTAVPYLPPNSPFQNGLTAKNSAVEDGSLSDLPRQQAHNCLCRHSHQGAGWFLTQPHNLRKAQ